MEVVFLSDALEKLPCEINAMCAVATGSGGGGRATGDVLFAESVVSRIRAI